MMSAMVLFIVVVRMGFGKKLIAFPKKHKLLNNKTGIDLRKKRLIMLMIVKGKKI